MENRVNGNLREKRGLLYVVLTWYEVIDGKKTRKFQWISTGLSAKGNKRTVQHMIPKLIMEKEEQLNYGVAAYDSKMFFSEYMNKWIEEKKNDKVKPIRQNTYEGYARQIRLHINPYFDKQCMKLCDLRRKHLDAFYAYLLNKGLCSNTIHKINVVIHMALAAAVDKELLSINPAVEIKSIPKIEKHIAEYYTEKELEELFKVFEGDPMEAVVKLTAVYGFRRSEVLGLRWSAVDFDEGTIAVTHTAIRLDKEIVYSDITKTASSRRILPLTSEIKAFLLSLLEDQMNNRFICGDSYIDNDYICKWFDGRLFDPSYVSHHFDVILKKKGMRKITFHELRHSAASYLISMGFSLKEVQEWLGHSTITITADIYSHIDLSAKRKIAEKIDQGLGGKLNTSRTKDVSHKCLSVS